MSALSQTRPDHVSQLIYHYTDQNGLLGIIKTRSLWATHFHHLNDESEWKIGCDLFGTCIEKLLEGESEIRSSFPLLSAALPGPELHDGLAEFLNGIAKTIAKQHAFVVSFSGSGPEDMETGRTAGDDLNQWRAYAGGSGGFAIGFDRNELVEGMRTLAQEESLSAIALNCIYNHLALTDMFRESAIHFLRTMENERGAANNQERAKGIADLVKVIARVKHAAFRSENEWRFIVLRRAGNRSLKFRSGRSSIVPFVELALAGEGKAISSIKEIVVGPSPLKENAVAALTMLLREYKYALREDGLEDGVAIKSSTIPYRNW